MTTHRITASQAAWLNNYDGTVRLAIRVAGVKDCITMTDGDQLYVTMQISQGKLSLKELNVFVALNEAKKNGVKP